MNVWNTSLKSRLTIIFIGLAIGPLLLVGVILAWRSFDVQRAQSLNLQRQIAQRVAAEANNFIQERERELRLMSEVWGLQRLDPEKQKSLLMGLLTYQDIYEELTLLDGQGQETLYLSRLKVVSAGDLVSRSGTDAFEKPQTTGETFFSSVQFDAETNEPFMTIAIPLVDPFSGTLDGVLTADFRFKKIWDLIASEQVEGDENIYILDNKGQVIAHRNPSVVLKGTYFDLPVRQGIHPGLDGKNVALAVDTVHLGEQAFTIVAEKPVSEALELAISTLYVVGGVILAALLIASSLAVLAARQIVRPIEALATAARAITLGDYEQKVVLTSQDEVGELANAFNHMTAQLHRLISELEQRVRELQDAQEQLLRQEKLAVLGQLSGGVAHELRNPLGAIKNAVYFLDMALEEPEANVQKMLRVLDKEVLTCEGIIRSLLDFARGRPPARRPVDLNHVVREALARVSVPESIEALAQLDEALPYIQADPDQLAQVFGNLILNAVQAMPEGGRLIIRSQVVRLRARLSSAEAAHDEISSPGWVSVSVSDTGVGIPPENLEKIFEPLFTTRARGIGLGLALVRNLVEGHGGRVEAQSKVGEGSTFTVSLPADTH